MNPDLQFIQKIKELGFDVAWTLYHGTPHAMEVIKEGFDLGKARGGTLGKGIYFADSAKKSHAYTGVRREPGRGILKNRESRLKWIKTYMGQTRHILQCQVALGHTEVLKSSRSATMGVNAGFDRYMFNFSSQVTIVNYS